MTATQAFQLTACPACGEPVMKVASTGLVSCLANLKFKQCIWHVRVKPFKFKEERDTMTKREQKLAEMQAEIDRRIEEANES